MALDIRPATARDVPLILDFIRGLAEYERMLDQVEATEERLHASLFPANGSVPDAHCVIGSVDGVAAGFALYFFNYSTFLARPGLYLEDLFVKPEFRGAGLGKALLLHLARSPTTAAADGWSGPSSTGTSRPSASTKRSARSGSSMADLPAGRSGPRETRRGPERLRLRT
jgi:GNAT superfamily N-acetyltransferase